MEKVMDWQEKTLVGELIQGKEMVEKLRNNLNSISSPEMLQILVEQIISSYDKVLSILNSGPCTFETKPTASTVESPSSYVISSPRSEVFDQDCKNQCQPKIYKKRKMQPRWTKQVRICSGTGMEGPAGDGYSWRKYGQKDILGAKFPRCYYRCTHRPSQGCSATKLVQRSDRDPTILEVTYKGEHTCFHSSRNLASLIDKSSDQNGENCLQEQHEDKPKPKPKPKSKPKPNPSKELALNQRDGIKSENIFTSFPFPEMPLYLGNEDEESYIFKESMIEESDHLLGSLTSPTNKSEFNYFSVSPCHYNTTTTPVTNSSMEDWESVDFDASFPLENHELFD